MLRKFRPAASLILALLLFAIAFPVWHAFATPTTYYISFSSGSNSNNGLSKSTPWKTHPYMQTASACTGTGSAPTYSHSAGDTFIFKQGDSWPNACFDMVMQAGGLSGAPDTYTFDPTWGTAGGTTNPITGSAVGTYQFTAGGAIIHGPDGWNQFISNVSNNVSNFVFNGVELAGFIDTADQTFGQNFPIDLQDATNSTISNIYVHGWFHGSSTADDMIVIAGRNAFPYNTGTRVTGSLFDGATDGGSSGEAIYAVPIVDHNVARNMSNGFVTGADSIVHDNEIGPINLSFEGVGDHDNCLEIDGPYANVQTVNYIYNNVWHDCAEVGLLTEGNAASNGGEIDWVWNNVAYQGTIGAGNERVLFQFDSIASGPSEIHVLNNTIYGDTQDCIRTINENNGPFFVLQVLNNFCMSNGSSANGINLGITGQAIDMSANIKISTAAAATDGYTSPTYAPTSGGNPTVGTGQNRSDLATGALATLQSDTTYGGTRSPNFRPSGGAAWDVGAYQFTSSGTPTLSFSPALLGFPNTAVGATASGLTVTLTNTGSPTLTLTSFTLTGINPADFAISSNTCGGTLTTTSSCAVTITFTPTLVGVESANLTIVDSASGSPQQYPLAGTGTSAGGSLQVGPGQTYATIQACMNVATSGQACNVHASTYAENVTFKTAGVTLQRNASDTVIVDGTIDILSFANSIVDGFQVTAFNAGGSAGIHAYNTTGGIIRNNTVHDATGAGILVRKSSDFQVYGNTVHDMAGPCCISDADGIVIYSASSTDGTYAHGVRVHDNTVYANHQDGIEINGSWESIYKNYVHDNIYSNFASTHPDGIECNNSADGITECPHTLIYGNTVKNQNQNIYIDGLGQASANSDIWIFDNIVFNDATSSTGVTMATSSSSEIILNVGTGGHVYNNFVGGTVQYFDICLGDCTGGTNASWAFTNVDIRNNIFENSLYYALWTYSASYITTMDDDVYFGNANLIHWAGINYSSLSAFAAATGFETHGQTSDPTTNALPTPTLQSGSPAIAAGANLSSLGVAALNSDAVGNARPSTGNWDMGPYVFSGAGSVPVVSFSPTSLAFSSTVGVASSPQTITLSNTGGASLTISSQTITGTNAADYSISSNTCGGTLGSSSTCAIGITFTPSALGARVASFTMADSAAGSPHAVPLTGTGTPAQTGPVASLSLTSVFSGNQILSTTSGPQTVTLTNTGTAAIAISSISVSGSTDFTQTNNCGSSVAASASCSLSITFTPSALGARSATVSIVDNAPGSPQTIALTGNGVTSSGGGAGSGAQQEFPGRIFVPNGPGGTILNSLTKFTGAPSVATKMATTDTKGAFGITIAGAGTSGNATVKYSGSAPCIFDGATTADDYVQISSSTAGDCHDAGAGFPSSGQVIGQVLSTNGSGGTYDVFLNPQPGAGGGVTSFNSRSGAVSPTSGDYTCAQVTGCTISPSSLNIFDDFLSNNTLSALGWWPNGGGGGVTIQAVGSNVTAANHPGLAQLQAGGSTNNWEYYILGFQNTPEIDPTANSFTITADFLPAATTIASPTGTLRFGVFDTTSMNALNPNSAVYFESVNGGAWNCIVNNSGTANSVSSGVSPATGTWQVFAITFNAASTVQTWTINGSPVCSSQTTTITSKLYNIAFDTTNNGTGQGQMLIDYFLLTWNLTR